MKENVNFLLSEALKTYNDDKKFLNNMIEFYHSKYPNQCSGENIFNQVYDHTIDLLNKANELEPNWQSYLLLYKVLKEKSYLGEGLWDNTMLNESSDAFRKFLEIKTSELAATQIKKQEETDLDKYFLLLIEQSKDKKPTRRLDSLYLLSNLYDVVEEPSKEIIQLVLTTMLEDESEDIRYHSAKLLSNLPSLFDISQNKLISYLYNNKYPKAKYHAVWVLGKHKSSKLDNNIKEILSTHDDIEFLRILSTAIGRLGNRNNISFLLDFLDIDDTKLIIRSLWSLGELGNLEAIDYILDLTKDDDFRIYKEAFYSLIKISKLNSTEIRPEILELKEYFINNMSSIVKTKPVLGATRFFITDWVVLKDKYLIFEIEDGHIQGHIICEIIKNVTISLNVILEKF